ncbi:hypothetical protein ACIP88_37400 [Streptomyces uncialis]|uniref:hypothetical protein n=1 Tax=Streptomyces uncialis TaxID=1048205 RepID=UPI003819ABDE
MSDRMSRLVQLRFLERVQLGDLERTRRWIADEERREAERSRGVGRDPLVRWLVGGQPADHERGDQRFGLRTT